MFNNPQVEPHKQHHSFSRVKSDGGSDVKHNLTHSLIHNLDNDIPEQHYAANLVTA